MCHELLSGLDDVGACRTTIAGTSFIGTAAAQALFDKRYTTTTE
jgi:hypothetical protein